MQTRGITHVHTSGEPSSYKTILTPSEFCGILMDMRDSYDLRDKTKDDFTARMMDDKRLADILDVYALLCEKHSDDNYTAILIEVAQ